LVVVAVAAITLFMAFGMSRLTTNLSQEAMMPEGYESIEAFNAISEKFGGFSFENVLVLANDVTNPRIAKVILDITPDNLEAAGVPEGTLLKAESYLDPLVQQVRMEGKPLPSSNIALGAAIDGFLSSDYAEKEIVGNTVSDDGRAALVRIQVDPDLDQGEQVELANSLEKALDEMFTGSGAQVLVGGSASVEKDAQEMMNNDTRVLFSIAVVFIMLILYLTFRRVSDIFLPLLVIVVAIQWILGIMGWVGIAYTTMSVAIMPLMLGINIAYVIHIMSRYYEERESGKNVFEASTASIKTVGVAVFLTAVTTVFGFASFTITDFPPMKDFGVVCMLGITFSFILSLTLLPAIIVLRDRRKETAKLENHLDKMKKRRREARYGKLIDNALARSSLAAYRYHWAVTGAVILLVALAIFAAFNLRTGADISKFFPEDLPSREANDRIAGYFGSQNQDVFLVAGDVLEPSNLEALIRLENKLAADGRNSVDGEKYFEREDVFSIADLVAGANDGEIPRSAEEVDAILEQTKQRMPLGGFISEDEMSAMVMIKLDMPETEEQMRILSGAYRDHADETGRETGLDVKPTGFTVLISDMTANILPTQFKTSGIALLLCLLVLVIVFRSFKYGLATLMVVVFGIVIEILVLYLLGWPLDFMTVTISSLLIGIGVDFGIHITHRFREELHHKGIELSKSIKMTVLHVGRSLVAAAFTTAGVFAILGISQMVPLRRFGITIAVGLVGALVGAVLVLPSMLAIIGKNNSAGDVANDTITPGADTGRG
jgi:uncharacterized protein